MLLLSSIRPFGERVGRSRTDRTRSVVNLAVSCSVSIAVGAVLWLLRPAQLSPDTNVIGYATFHDWNYQKPYLAYRIVIWQLPIVAVLVFAALQRWAPWWRQPSVGRSARAAIVRLDHGPGVVDGSDERPTLFWPLQVLPAAALAAIAYSARSVSPVATVDRGGILAGLFYIAVVAVVTAGILLIGRDRAPGRSAATPRDVVSLVNGIGAVVVAFGSLVFVSRHTMVVTASSQRHNWPWFPLWLGVAAMVGTSIALLWLRRRGFSSVFLERRVRTILVGSTLLFISAGRVIGTLGPFQGFDDSQSITGADLVTRGYFPWRDVLLIHGFWEDALRSLVGFALFQKSAWGALAAFSILIVPLCWVSIYLFAVWAGRRGSLLAVGVFVLLAWGAVGQSVRFVAVPVVFLLLGLALQRDRPGWTVLFTSALFIEAVLVPETTFQVFACAVAIVASDVVHRRGAWWPALRRTRYFAVTGLAWLAAFSIYLMANRALGAFVNYFFVFAPGHAASGALPPNHLTRAEWALFVLDGGLVVLTIAAAGRRLMTRRGWSAQDWVAVAAAIFAGLYGEKALGRFDGGHVVQTIDIALPLWALWIAKVLSVTEAPVRDFLRRISRPRIRFDVVRQPVAVVGVIALLLCVPGTVSRFWHVPGRSKATVFSLTSTPLLGYSYKHTVDPSLLADLRTVLNTYAGTNGAIFDNTQSEGYFHYLLGRPIATPLYIVGDAQTMYSQRQLINDLNHSRPPVVVFDESVVGLSAWDGPRNNVRHFAVAQYLLDGWTPVLRSHTVLFMLRNDLFASRPAAPRLTTPPQTTGLYFSSPACDWGDSANFLQSPPTGTSLDLKVSWTGLSRGITARGWTFDSAANRPVELVLLATNGRVVQTFRPSVSRPDIARALQVPSALSSGFEQTAYTSQTGDPQVFAKLADGKAHLIRSGDTGTRARPQALQMPDGSSLPVSSTPARGYLDVLAQTTDQLGTVTVPAGTDLSSYQLARFSASAEIGAASVSLSDDPDAVVPDPSNSSRGIIANALPVSGSSLAVRVGSCLQWHGYRTRILYVRQHGGRPVDRIQLSSVRS